MFKFLICAMIFCGMAHAEETIQSALPWSVKDRKAITGVFKGDYGRFVTASINYDGDGNKRIYFSIEQSDSDSACNPVGFNSSGVIIVGRQPVKVYRWCKKFADTNSYYIEVTAETDKGDIFVYNSLKNSKDYILITFDGEAFKFSAVNFNEAWESVGDKAL